MNVVADWLRDTFSNVAEVKFASREPDSSVIYQPHQADVVVATWMGARFYVYVLHTAPRLRDIRNTLRDNSRNGIGTLFVINQVLLPEDAQTVRVADWLEGLLSLADSWVYGYTIDDDGLSLTQVNFNATPVDHEYYCWHIDDFRVEHVSVRKREISNGVKGEFSIADIASPNYKRRVNYERVNQRFHYKTKATGEIPHSRQNRQPAQGGSPEQLLQYYRMVGVDHTATEAEVKAAFRRQAMQVHPDVSALPRTEAERRIKLLNEAYEFIKSYHGWG